MTSADAVSPSLAVVRALLALAVVFVLLSTTGWTTIRHRPVPGPSREAALTAWARDRIDHRPLPGPDSPARTVAGFFAGLGHARGARLAERHPLVVGNLDGAPVALRYRANRITLGRALDTERGRVDDARLSPEGRHEARRRFDRFASLMRPGRQILAFDPTGTGRTAEVLGDLERARRVSVIVPGVDTNLLTFQKTHGRYAAPAGMAEALYAAERRTSPRARVAVIAWADYTAPAGVGVDAATGRLAEEGAVRLVKLTGALPGSARVALFCHSYGSVLCGVAAPRLSGRVTDVAVAGSPGMRVERAADLATRARVWAMRDADDWIADVPHLEVGGLGHGADPVEPEFGARLLSARGALGHSGYFEPGTESLGNFAAIGVGAYPSLVCARADSACHDGISGAEGL
ncbi:alpha/beta hydrolase [Streptomyces sp. SR27]|uniref:alpha/beta hydrolase n=1 Tax=Streptomyces sp. SR27 TaxID=3076630 RepID=UPI00295AE97C|nr:alpha/beta hydrolase [Streptomyces sp. SR27]MDV9187927.1 alpha/beta hydrolase [Streptomyces sp. SR27]